MTTEPFHPDQLYGSTQPAPRVYISPSRYIQGPGTIDEVGTYVRTLDPGSAAILASPRRRAELGDRLARGLAKSGRTTLFLEFGGETSMDEIAARTADLDNSEVSVFIALGGGKCIDAAKAIAYRIGVPLVVVPSLASNDAPCSASSVIYDASGVFQDVEFYPESPYMVVVDSGVIASAPERFLVAGIGDAMATWYEARVVAGNPDAVSTLGTRPSIAAVAIGKACAEALFDFGVAAAEAVRDGVVNEALEDVIEANTLLSGIGFESGGLAAAHGIGMSFTSFEEVHDNYLHGEMVAYGVLAQLMLESEHEEAKRVAGLFDQVGLPITLDQLSVDPDDIRQLDTLASGTVAFPFTANMPFQVNEEMVVQALRDADSLGRSLVKR